MSTTIKRVALVAVAALGLGVVSVAPSVATVASLTVTTTNGTATTTKSDSTTAASISISALVEATDTISVTFIEKDVTAGAAVARLYLETTTTASTVANDGILGNSAAASVWVSEKTASDSKTAINAASAPYGVSSLTTSYVAAKFRLQFDSTTALAEYGTYTYTVLVKTYTSGVEKTSTPYDVNLVIATPAASSKVAVAAKATAYIQQISGEWNNAITDSVVAISSLADNTQGALIRVNNYNASDAKVSDTVTVTVSGPGVVVYNTTASKSISFFAGAADINLAVKADGGSGATTITITTAAGASFVKSLNFFSNTPASVSAVVKKAYIKAGTASVSKVFAVTVKDAADALITNATITAAATDTTTTVGGAATCGAFDAKDKVYYCAVAGLSATKFGAVGYTIKATGADVAKTVLSTTASTTFADNVATKIVIAGPASATPGQLVTYTLTATEKNGYPVADQTYGDTSEGGNLFAKAVASGWTTAPFSASESFTSVSGVMESEGVAPIAGEASVTWTLVGDGIQTLTTSAVDKTIGKTTITVATAVTNPGVDAATDAANEAAQAASDATDAALAASDAADAATTKAQEAVDAVATLSAQVSKLITALKAQITTLTNLVIKIQKKVRA